MAKSVRGSVPTKVPDGDRASNMSGRENVQELQEKLGHAAKESKKRRLHARRATKRSDMTRFRVGASYHPNPPNTLEQ